MINKIQLMLAEVNKYKRNHDSLMPMYIEERLSASFNVYNTELQQSIEFLQRKHEKSLLKRLNKLDGKTN